MGQNLSKSLSSRLASATRRNERSMLKEAIEDTERRKAEAAAGKHGGFTDPNATSGGFRRDRGAVWEVERRQEEYLRSQSNRDQGGNQRDTEMNEDLLKFLNEAGPLERRVDKTLTSPKVYDSLSNEEEERRLQEKESSLRRRRRMPLAERLGEGFGGDSDVEPWNERSEEERMALSVERTTNFSTSSAGEEEEDPTAVRLRDVDLTGLLRRSTTGTGAGTVPSAEEAAEAYLRDIEETFPEGVTAATGVRVDNLSLMTNAIKYGGVPTLMKEVETANFVGAWEHKVEGLKAQQIRLVGDGEIRLGLDEIKRKEESEAEDMRVLEQESAVSGKEETGQLVGGTTQAVAYSGEKEVVTQGTKPADPAFDRGLASTSKTPEGVNLSRQRSEERRKESSATGTAAFLKEEKRRIREQADDS